MADFWKSLKNTAESIGGAAIAPAGAVFDLAMTPFDDEDDDFGSIVAKLAGRAGDIVDPLLNEDTATGYGFTKTMQGLDWVYREEIGEPTAAALTQIGSALHNRDAGLLFDEDAWAEAYEVAQDRSIGQAAALLAAEAPWLPVAGAWGGIAADDRDELLDPMDERAYRQMHENGGAAATAVSGTVDFYSRWYLDPGVVLGKAAATARAKTKVRQLSLEERGTLLDRLHTDKAQRYNIPVFGEVELGKHALGSRTDKYLDFINGAGPSGRPLNAAETYLASPDLARSANGRVIAGLLADAGRLADVPKELGQRAILEGQVKARNAQRRILAVAAGDMDEVARLHDEVAEAGSIADQLKNMLRGTTLELKTQDLVPSVRTNPVFIADLERQLGNLNSTKEIDRFVNGWMSRQQSLLETAANMKVLPGASAQGRRALGRNQGKGLLDKGGEANTGYAALDNVVDAAAKPVVGTNTWLRAQHESASTVFAKSAYGVPLLVIKTAGLAASPWTRYLPRGVNALRTAKYHGLANLHDWDSSQIQLDSMMRAAKLRDEDRLDLLAKATLARTEPERQQMIARVESAAVRRLAERHQEQFPGEEISPRFIEELMTRGQKDRGARLTASRARAFAATPDARVDDAALTGRVGQSAVDEASGVARKTGTQWQMRVDQVNDDGVPVSLPVLETQLANVVPMIDIDLAEKVLSREGSRMSRLAKAWESERHEIERLSRLKAPAGSALDKALQARRAAADSLVDAASTANRMWKFSVLFRLGYPMRVVLDDHMRIWSQVNAMSFYGDNSAEAVRNLGYNLVGRHRETALAASTMRYQRREYLDQAEAAETAGYDGMLKASRSMHRSIQQKRRALARWREESKTAGPGEAQEALGKKIRDAEAYIADKEAAMYHLIDELPDQSPAELRKQADELTRQLDSVKAGDKRHIGQRGFSLNGVHYDGAFATPTGAAYREGTRSQATYDAVIKGSEETTYHGVSKRAHRIIQPTEPGHIDAWASAVNFQFRQSAVAMHFIEGGDVKSFVKWLNKPEQKHLRDRVPHFAHDPEDWGHRVQQLVDDYLPTQGLREAAAKGEVRGKQFRKEVPEGLGPAVHGAVVADNLGTSGPVLLAGKALNRAMRWLAETPTDRLARHPYFNSMYKQYVKENHELVAIAKRKQAVDGKVQFTEADRQLVMKQARASALTDLKRTLFDISAHSNAAHAMRFLSPFFAAHQESLARWWRIVADDPSVIRRFQQAFDMPRKLELVYDYETGELVESGEGISTNHRLLLQVPHAWGGRKIETVEVTDEDGTTRKVIADPEAFSKWSLGENSFNIVLQGGLMNPGAGPLVSLPTEFLAAKYANEEEITRVARVFNPFPPQQPTDVLWPATAKRFIAAIQKDGNKEYNARYNQNLQDATTKFLLENGREPSESEAEELMLRAGRETNVDMWLRFANNALSPMPASPGSRYQAVTHGWRQIMDLSQDKGYGFEWALEKFKERYGEAYMPLVYSTSNNPAGVDITAGAVGSYKRHKPLLERVDHRLHRGVMGADGKGEYTAEARAFFMNQRMRSGSADTYLSNDEPRAAHLEHMVKRGWDKYSAMSAQLEVLAEEFGLASYRDSEVLVEARREAVESLKAENYAWGEEWDSFNPNEFNTILDDLNRVAFESELGKDTLRGDVRVLQDYLASRDAVVQIMEERRAAGLTFSPDAKDMQPVMSEFTRYVGELVESNTEFHEYWFDGLLERDPLLTGELE